MRTVFVTAAAALAAHAAAAQQPIPLEAIVVSADRTPTAAERTGPSVGVVGAADLQRETFVLDALDRVPGVALTQSGPPGAVSDLFLRGLPQRYVRLRVDGIEVSDPTAPQVTPSFSGLLSGGLARAEVLKGSHSALYGGQAVAGVVDITTAEPTRDGLEQQLEVEAGSRDTLYGRYVLAGRGQRAEGAFNAQRFRTDGFSAAAAGSEPDGYETTRLSASGSLYPTDWLRLFASGFWQDEEGDQDGFPPPDFALVDTDETFAYESWGARAGAEFDLGAVENTLAVANFDIERRFYDDDGALGDLYAGERQTVEYLGELELERGQLQFGADYNREEATFSPRPGVTDSWIAGLWGQVSWSPRDTLTLGIALRQDEHSAFGGYTTGRVTATYRLPTETLLRASVGTGFRPPSLNELYGPFGGNPDLEPETSVSYDLGVEQPFAEGRGQVSATLFQIEIDDLITFSATDLACFGTEIPPGTRCYEQLGGGTARSRGVELAGSWEFRDGIAVSAAYTYTDAEQADGSRRLRVPRHDLALTADAELTDRVEIGVTVRHVADVTDLPAAPGTEGDAFGDYTTVDARGSYALTETAALTVRVENALDEEYQTVRGYNMSGRSVYLGVSARF